jgi:hypothetical protein
MKPLGGGRASHANEVADVVPTPGQVVEENDFRAGRPIAERLVDDAGKRFKRAWVSESIGRDVSPDVLNAWTACLDSVPALDELRNVINAPLQRALPYPSSWARRPFPPDADVAEESRDSLMPELMAICCTLFARRRNGTSENALVVVYDSLITDVLALLRDWTSVPLRFERGAIDEGMRTTGQSLPDFRCWLHTGVLAFKGEEAATAEELHVATEELSSKLAAWTPTFFGEVPYQLAYAAGGEIIQFFAMDLRNGGKRVPLCDAFSVATPTGRSRCVRIAVNIFRVLRTLDVRLPEYCLALGGVITKSYSCQVIIHGDFVSKCASSFTGPELEDLYLALLARPVECLARPKKAPRVDAWLTVQIQPVGFFRNPGEQIKTAARSVLTALCGLHDMGWVHRDVRAENVMQVLDAGWFLMDLEWAQRAGLPVESYAPKRANTPPEIGDGGEAAIWTAASDMWQFGRMLDFWENRASPLCKLGRELSGQLMAERPEDRPTARQALSHSWLM